MSKILLIEYIPFALAPQQLKEYRINEDLPFIVQGKLQAKGKPNANRRIYGESLVREVEKYKIGPIAEQRALGELDHPETSVINLKNVSHNILDLWWDGDDLHGRIEVLDTPSGNILKALFRKGIKVGISSRAMGSVTPISEDLLRVEDDLELICWDFVSTPSTFGSFVAPVNVLKEHYTPAELRTFDRYKEVDNLLSDIICTQTGVCCIK
jgi:hypothetical protein